MGITMIYKINPLIEGEVAERNNEFEIDSMYNNKYTDESIYLKLLKSGESYKKYEYCYNYALKLKYIGSCENGLEILQATYKRISLKQLRKGDIITFFTAEFDDNDVNADNIQHFGIIKKTDNTLNGTIILSKWGTEGIFETNLNSLPEFYGSKICFWRKKK